MFFFFLEKFDEEAHKFFIVLYLLELEFKISFFFSCFFTTFMILKNFCKCKIIYNFTKLCKCKIILKLRIPSKL